MIMVATMTTNDNKVATAPIAGPGGDTDPAVGRSLMTSLVAAKVDNALQTPEQRLKQERDAQRRFTVVVVILALVTMSLALVIMAIEGTVLCYVAFIIPLVLAPRTIYLQRRINKLPKYRHVINSLRQEVNRLALHNLRIQQEVNRLEGEVAALHEAETRLDAAAVGLGTNSTTLRNMVQENGQILREIEKLQAAEDVQALLSAVLASDTNNDSVLTEKELDILMIRLQALRGKNYPSLNLDHLREQFKSAGRINSQGLENQPSIGNIFLTASMFYEEQDEGDFDYKPLSG